MIRLFQVKCANENEIEAQILKKLRIRKEDLLQWHVHRKVWTHVTRRSYFRMS